MLLPESLGIIRKFWREPAWPFGQPPDGREAARISQEFACELPAELREYVAAVVPARSFLFTAVGNPLEVYGIGKLKYRQEGYNFNPVTGRALTDWPPHWFILADEGADPIIIDLQAADGRVQKLYHGAGSWEEMADSIGQFLLCAAAVHHALHHFEQEPTIDDANGFNLAPQAASWLFPNLSEWAPAYYESWCSCFDNR